MKNALPEVSLLCCVVEVIVKMINKEEIRVINETIIQAEQFIDRAKELKEFLEEDGFSYQSKIRSSARRASMDLSRLLTEFRKPK